MESRAKRAFAAAREFDSAVTSTGKLVSMQNERTRESSLGGEYPIKEVALAAGVTSRTLRHYEHIGLLLPSRVGENGYRFYGDAELSRLYKVLSLRSLDVPLAAIKVALAGRESLAQVVESHLGLLRERQIHLSARIAEVENVLEVLQKGQEMSAQELFAGMDSRKHEDEVRSRWGDEAWEASMSRYENMGDEARDEARQRTVDVNLALREAAASGLDPASGDFHALIADHYEWVAESWGGIWPQADAYLGLAQMYVSDARFASTYGGEDNASRIQQAIELWVAENLPSLQQDD